MVPAIGGLGGLELVRVGQRAVALGGILRGVAEGDMGLAGNHRRLARLFRGGDGGVDGLGVVAVNFLHMPAGGLEALHLIGAVGQFDGAVDGDVVVVPEHDQLAQGMTPGEADGFLADAFHEAAVTGDHIGVVIDEFLAVLGALDLFGHGETDSVGDALAKGAGRGFNGVEEKILGVARGQGAHLAEVLDLIEGDLGVTDEMQQRIDQHRAVTGRQDKAVAVGPFGGRGIELEVFFEEHGGHIGHAHGHAGMTGVGGGHGIKRQRANGGGFHPVVGVLGAKGSDIHVAGPLTGGSVLGAQYQPIYIYQASPRPRQGQGGSNLEIHWINS